MSLKRTPNTKPYWQIVYLGVIQVRKVEGMRIETGGREIIQGCMLNWPSLWRADAPGSQELLRNLMEHVSELSSQGTKKEKSIYDMAPFPPLVKKTPTDLLSLQFWFVHSWKLSGFMQTSCVAASEMFWGKSDSRSEWGVFKKLLRKAGGYVHGRYEVTHKKAMM